MDRSQARSELNSLGIDYTDVDEFLGSLRAGALATGGAGNLAAVKLFVVAGMDVNAKGRDGGTALHEAVGQGRLDIVKYLVDRGACVRARDDYGRTPRGRAAERGHTDVVAYFDSLDEADDE